MSSNSHPYCTCQWGHDYYRGCGHYGPSMPVGNQCPYGPPHSRTDHRTQTDSRPGNCGRC